MKINKEYYQLVAHILNSHVFRKLNEIPHHGTTRLNHSIKVSYYSYLISKKLKLDYKICAISGLLHDFYLQKESKNLIKFLKFQKKHPKIAIENAKKYFNINKKEENIIGTHMFPLTKPSKYKEGWIVSAIDKIIGAYEYIKIYKKKMN